MKILATGSEGSLMQATIPYLLEQGHEVIGADNFSRYGVREVERDYELVRGDLCDPQFADSVTRGVDVVIQAAATIYGVGGFHKCPADILSRDVVLHQNILWSALRHEVKKVVYISSSMVYERCTDVPSREDDVDNMPPPLTDYGLSKYVGERLSTAFHEQYGLKYTIWRPFNIITPQEEAAEEIGTSHVFADFLRRIVKERRNPIPILGDGQQIRCFTWIEDVAGGIARHSLSAASDCGTYNLGNPEPVTMQDLARRIYAAAVKEGIIPDSGELRFDHLPAYKYDVRLRIPSIGRAERKLGWQPTVKLDQALEICVRAAAERGITCPQHPSPNTHPRKFGY